ncbi:MAG: acylphosphatase [Myxococcota bacterium]
MSAKEFFVEGRVQGVGFRAFVQRAAVERRLSGWVRNLADGRVQAQVTGDPKALVEMERLLHQGPTGARVESVCSRPCSEEPWDEFDVRPTVTDSGS